MTIWTTWMIGQVLNSPAVIAAIAALGGGVGLKLIEAWLNRNTAAVPLREQLNQEIKDLRDRLDRVEEEVTLWRNRYYEEQEKAALLRVQIIGLGETPADTVTLQLHTHE